MENFKNQKLLRIILIMVAIYLFFLIAPYLKNILSFILDLLLPFILGFTMAFIFLPFVEFLTRHKVSRKISVIIVLIIFIGVIAGVFVIFTPIIVNELIKIISKLPFYIDKIQQKINLLSDKMSFLPEDFLPDAQKIEVFMVKYLEKVMTSFLVIIQKGISSIVTVILGFVLMIYFLLDFDKIITWMKEKSALFTKIDGKKYLCEVRDTMQAYFKGVVLVSFILMLTSYLAFTILDVEYALMLGIIIGVTDIIPYLGPYLGGGIAVIVALTTSYQKAIIVVIIVIILQTLESWFLTPKIQSKTVKIHPIYVLLALFFFGKIWGILGMVVAVPILSIIQTTLKMEYYKE